MEPNEQVSYTVKPSDYAVNWLISEVIEIPFEAAMVPTVFPNYHPGASVKDKNGKEIVSPAKQEFLSIARFEKSAYPQETVISKLYIPFDTTRVDCSNFWYTPHDIYFYAKTFLTAAEEGEHSFEISTCGAVKVWVNQVEAAVFTPYQANMEEKKQIVLPLKKGVNEILVGCNNYGERNIIFNFGLKNTGDEISGFLPVHADVERIRAVRSVLHSLFVEKLSYDSGDIYLCADKPFAVDCQMNAKVCQVVKTLYAKAGEQKLVWGNADELPIGYHEFKLSCEVDGVELAAVLWAECYPDRLRIAPHPNKGEKAYAGIAFIVAQPSRSLGQYMAYLNRGENRCDTYCEILDELASGAQKREDCSDFKMLRLLWMLVKYRELLTPEQIGVYEETVLGFRYWFDEKGNDAMWFFSENHALCFHTAEMLAGELFPDRVFSNSGMTGTEHTRKAKALIGEWFEKFFTYGFNEWNSPPYIPVDIHAFVTMFALCKDGEIQASAKKALDYTYNIFAQNSFHGVLGTASGRTYPRNLLANKNLETNPLLWLAWGCGCLNAHTDVAMLLAIAGYRPPEHLAEIADWNRREKYNSVDLQGIVPLPIKLPDKPEAVSIETRLCKTADYILGTSSTPRSGWLGSQEHLLNIFLEDGNCRIWVNHPGERKIFGSRRPGYFAGNGLTPLVTQHQNIAVMSYQFIEPLLARAEVGFTHAFCDAGLCDETFLEDHWFFARRGSAFAALYASNGLRINTTPPLKNKELISDGINGTWFLKVSEIGEIESFEAFAAYMKAHVPEIRENKLFYEDYEFGRVEFELMTEGGSEYAKVYLSNQ
jgi:hypothetical protein